MSGYSLFKYRVLSKTPLRIPLVHCWLIKSLLSGGEATWLPLGELTFSNLNFRFYYR